MSNESSQPAHDDREAVADLLDELLSVLAQSVRGGEKRMSTVKRSRDWTERFTLLERETRVAIRTEDAKAKRNAARRKQMKKKRTMEKKL